ncbi:cupredoxin family copper-binding protein [Rhizobium sp. CCGE 510]|uniref:cupredoxin domain-containing protein n=1 Tax=Rhizobium sp. CCGE 510 TaxID=1132836 RepID=UPI00027B8EAA|nr:cupredoxin family copper-binding protein [Rhizobium sp. CCGE 510]EJT02382.1 amicyanin [Rhizobium sp. CCGE 510]
MNRLMKSLPLPLALFWASSSVASAAEYQVTIAGMKFSAPPAELHVGDVIVWRNDDIFRHTATARDKSFDIDLPPKSEGRMTISRAGAVDFYCRFHPAMTGKLNVRP